MQPLRDRIQSQPVFCACSKDSSRLISIGDWLATSRKPFRDFCNRSAISVFFLVANQLQTGCRVGVSTPEPIDSLPASASEIDIKSNELKCLIPILNAVPLCITWKKACFFSFKQSSNTCKFCIVFKYESYVVNVTVP